MDKLNLDQAGEVSGGFVLKDDARNNFWVIGQDGSKITPAPTLEKAQEYAKEYNVSPSVYSTDFYKTHFGRDFE
ncbi:MAG: hypothetical protein IJL90_07715 [Lachnospiraceae bacterium]|nr:hypothetical protein [Lachnospiraceae bacterium]